MSIMTPNNLGGNPQVAVQEQPFGQDYRAIEANSNTLPAIFRMLQQPQQWGQLENLLNDGIAAQGGLFGHLMSNKFAENPYFKGWYGRTGASPVITVYSPNVQTKVPVLNRMASNLTFKTTTTIGAGAGLPVTGVVVDTAIGSSVPQVGRIYRATTAAGATQEFVVSAAVPTQSTNIVTCTIVPRLASVTLGVFNANTKFWQCGETGGTTTVNQSQVQTRAIPIFQNNRIGVNRFRYQWEVNNVSQKVYWGITADLASLANPFVRGLGIPTAGNYQLSWSVDFLTHVVNYMIGVENQLVWSVPVDDAQSQYFGLFTGEDILTTVGVVPTIEELGFALTYTPGSISLYDFTSFQQAIRRADFSMVANYILYSGDNYDLDFQQFTTQYARPVELMTVNKMEKDLDADNSLGDRVLAWGIRKVAISGGVEFATQCYGQFTSTVNGTTGTDAAYTNNCMLIPMAYYNQTTIQDVTYNTPTIVLMVQGTRKPQFSTVTDGIPSPAMGQNPFMMQMDVTSTAPAAAALGIAQGAYTVAENNISTIKGEMQYGVFLNNAFACAMMKPA